METARRQTSVHRGLSRRKNFLPDRMESLGRRGTSYYRSVQAEGRCSLPRDGAEETEVWRVRVSVVKDGSPLRHFCPVHSIIHYLFNQH